MRTFISIFYLFSVSIVNVLSFFVPKNKRIWVFGALKGKKYCDNSKYLFEYVSGLKGYKAAWLSSNQAVVEQVKSKGLVAYNFYSIPGMLTAMRAGVAVVTHRGINKHGDLPFFALSKRTRLIQLWHGVPLKKIAFDDVIFSRKRYQNQLFRLKMKVAAFFFGFLKYIDDPDLIICTSEFIRPVFAKAFRVPENRVLVTGYPRNDMLFEYPEKDQHKEKKSIIYMPTFRGNFGKEYDPLFQHGFDIERFDRFLEKNQMTLTLKLHPFNLPDNASLGLIARSANINLYEGVDIYEKIAGFDVLLTDYSSIYFDFLLMGKPIIFTPFDKSEYLVEHREFYFDYNDTTPGPKAEDWDDVCTLLSNLDKVRTEYQDKIERLRNKFHDYQDGDSRQRVYSTIVRMVS